MIGIEFIGGGAILNHDDHVTGTASAASIGLQVLLVHQYIVGTKWWIKHATVSFRTFIYLPR